MIVVLVVLVMMFLAGLGVMRAADTSNVISGNFMFQQAAVQASDRGLTDALNVVANRVLAGQGNTAIANQYWNTITTPVNARGIPNAVDWSLVACADDQGAVITAADCAVDSGNYRVQFVVERRCANDPVLTDPQSIRANCEYEANGSSNLATASGMHIAVRYRAIIRVQGPRGTETWFESMFSGPAHNA
jgi:Tfp pilus assembly protein PilX